MCCGTDNTLLELDRTSLARALADATQGHLAIRGQNNDERDALTLEEVADKLQKLYRLPPMPALALRILRLTANSEATARELGELIEFDPSLTAQIMRYARSALFNYPGQINSVQEAVTRFLGLIVWPISRWVSRPCALSKCPVRHAGDGPVLAPLSV